MESSEEESLSEGLGEDEDEDGNITIVAGGPTDEERGRTNKLCWKTKKSGQSLANINQRNAECSSQYCHLQVSS